MNGIYSKFILGDMLAVFIKDNRSGNVGYTLVPAGFDEKIELVDKKGDERNAISSRVRILRFADEMMENRKHSKDAWSQLLVDCDIYEDYCKVNEDFRNNITSATISYLKANYTERLEKHDFL